MYANDDVRYALNRLLQTMVRYQGQLVTVTNVLFNGTDQPLQVYSEGVKSGLQYNDVIGNYDLTPVPLGFVNIVRRKNVNFLSRIPIREDWRQGLRQNNARTVWGLNVWDDEAIANTVENIFPTIEHLRGSLNGEEQLGAWHRDFAMDGCGSIYYRTEGRIGQFIGDSCEYLLDGPFTWVEESLKEALDGYVR